jgi:hypothetical protein
MRNIPIVFLFLIIILPVLNACRQERAVCGLKSSGQLYVDEKEALLKKLTISDTSMCYIKTVVIEKDSLDFIPLPFARINISNEEKDTINCVTDFEGECSLLIKSGLNRLFLNYLSVYNLDTTINFEKGVIVELRIMVNKQSTEKVKTTIQAFPYRIPDLFKSNNKPKDPK